MSNAISKVNWSMNTEKVLDHLVFYTICAVFPLLTAFHAAFSPEIQVVLLTFRTVLIPMLAYFFVRDIGSPWSLLMLVIFLLVTGFGEFVNNTEDFIQNLIYLVSFVILFRFGNVVPGRCDPRRLGNTLLLSSVLLNVCVAFLYGFVLSGLIDVAEVYAVFEPDRDPILGAGRFSIGNAIEVPFLSTVICFAASRLAPSNRLLLVAVVFNLLLALISESRVVNTNYKLLLLSLFFGTKNKLFLTIIGSLTVYGIILIGEEVVGILESIGQRFLGDDAGSGSDRLFLYGMVISWLNGFNIIFGEGLTASLVKMEMVTGTYRTVEALFLELIYELGILGILLLLISLTDGLSKKIVTITLSNVILMCIWAQLLLFLPLNPLTPITGFCIGLATKRKSIRDRKAFLKKYEKTND